MSDYTDSDSDYNENEKILLDKYRKRKYESDDENEEGVFNVAPDGGESYDDEDILADSDIEGQEEDVLPNEKAWGRNKKAYYSSDYVNPNTFNEKELQFAEFEAEEAKKFEAEIYQEFLDSPGVFKHDKKEYEEEQDLNERQIKQAKEEQELLSHLITDFKEYIHIYKGYMKPVVEGLRNGEIRNSSLTEFVECFSSLILNYSSNIFMYLLLKSSKAPTIHHPISKRLQQYRQCIQRLHPVFEKTVKSKIAALLEEKNEINISRSSEPKKKLKLLQNLVLEKPVEKQKKESEEEVKKNVQFSEKDEIHEMDKEENHQEVDQSDKLEKRPITYKMAKNKGLTPHRKKEQRNPRVKHRNKYKKAKVRRKGAVREVRNEGRRYDGEMSGIKTNVTKGIKIKV